MRDEGSVTIKRAYDRAYLMDEVLVSACTPDKGEPCNFGKTLHKLLSNKRMARDPSDESKDKILVDDCSDLAGGLIKDLWTNRSKDGYYIQSAKQSSIYSSYNYVFTYIIKRSPKNKLIEMIDSIKVIDNKGDTLFCAEYSEHNDTDTLWEKFEEYCLQDKQFRAKPAFSN